MKIKSKKNKLVIPLIALTFVVWGMIIYNLINYYLTAGSDEDNVVIETGNSQNVKIRKVSAQTEETTYKELERDPFTFSRRVKKEPEPVVQAPVPRIEPPKPQFLYKITGAIINDKSKLIIFEDQTNNKTLFLREGETYNSIKIKSISFNNVTVIEDGKTKDIPVMR